MEETTILISKSPKRPNGHFIHQGHFILFYKNTTLVCFSVIAQSEYSVQMGWTTLMLYK